MVFKKVVPGDRVKVTQEGILGGYLVERTIAEGVIKAFTSFADDLGKIGDVLLEDGRAFIGSAGVHIVPV